MPSLNEPHELRLVALDRAVNLASTGRIDPDDVTEVAEEFHTYLAADDADSGSGSLDDVLLKLTRIEVDYDPAAEAVFMAQATVGIGVTFADDGQTIRFTVR